MNGSKRLVVAYRVTQAILVFEKLWPVLTAFLGMTGLSLIYAWLDLPLYAPTLVTRAVTGLVILSGLAVIVKAIIIERPAEALIIERLDRAWGMQSLSLRALFDRPVGAAGDGGGTETSAADMLWRAHQDKIRAALTRPLRLRWHSDMARRDRFALRYHVILVTITLGLLAGPERMTKLAIMVDVAFNSDQTDSVALEGWIDPPSYTKSPPIFLNMGSDQSQKVTSYSIPAGSLVVFRHGKTNRPTIALQSDGAAFSEGGDEKTAASSAPPEADHMIRRWRIQKDTQIRIQRGWRDVTTIDLNVLPDHPPQIELVELRAVRSDLLIVNAHMSDDYAVARAFLRVRVPPSEKSGDSQSLIDPPLIPLTRPDKTRDITSETKIGAALIPRAYAGLTTEAELYVEDEAGQSGTTPPFTVTLPFKSLISPLARAYEEQGQILQRDANSKENVEKNLDALSDAPEIFKPDYGVHLGTRLIRRDIEEAYSRTSLIEAGQSLYALADVIDDAFKSDARRVLDDVRERLRQALEAKADEHMIRALLDEFSTALKAYLDDYRRRALDAKKNSPRDGPKGKSLRAEDLQSLLDKMRDRLGKGQSLDALLDRLDPLLDALEAGDASPQLSDGDPSGAAEQALDGMIRDQQGLRDDTFRNAQRDTTDPMSDLQARQNALRETLKALTDDMNKQDLAGQDALADAAQAMKEAEDSLGKGDERGALRQQEDALKSLRNGARALAQANKDGSPGQNAKGQGRKGQASPPDPFGRDQGTDPADGDWADNDRAMSDRAAHILELLREVLSRSSDLSRPAAERDYLKRLLDRESMP